MRNNKKRYIIFLILIFFINICCLSSCNFVFDVTKAVVKQSNSNGDEQASIHFIDVGQADCILILLPDNQVMLIDAGSNSKSDDVVAYLKSKKVEKIDYLIGTHPHEDHIGGMDVIIDRFDIGTVYMPHVSATTKTFKDVLESVKRKGLTITTAKSGVDIISNENLKIKFVAPNSEQYAETNDYSAVVYLNYKNAKAIFMGDAEKTSELEILNNHKDISANLIKIGHHGSSSSTDKEFLDAVSPENAVIMVGEGNSYKHPSKITLDTLGSINVHRTDLDSTIVFEFKNGKWEKQ